MDKKQNHRKIRSFFHNHPLQPIVIFTYLIYSLLFVFITVCAVLSPFLFEMYRPQDIIRQQEAARMFWELAPRAIPGAVILFIIVYIHQVITTHRIIGPMINITSTLEHIAKGDLTRKIYIRSNDLLEKECDKINGTINALAQHIKGVNQQHCELAAVLEKIKAEAGDDQLKQEADHALEIVKNVQSAFKY